MKSWKAPPKRWEHIGAWSAAFVAVVVFLRMAIPVVAQLVLKANPEAAPTAKLLAGILIGVFWILGVGLVLCPLRREMQHGRREAIARVAGGQACAQCWGTFEPGDRVFTVDGFHLCEEHAQRLGDLDTSASVLFPGKQDSGHSSDPAPSADKRGCNATIREGDSHGIG